MPSAGSTETSSAAKSSGFAGQRHGDVDLARGRHPERPERDEVVGRVEQPELVEVAAALGFRPRTWTVARPSCRSRSWRCRAPRRRAARPGRAPTRPPTAPPSSAAPPPSSRPAPTPSASRTQREGAAATSGRSTSPRRHHGAAGRLGRPRRAPPRGSGERRAPPAGPTPARSSDSSRATTGRSRSASAAQPGVAGQLGLERRALLVGELAEQVVGEVLVHRPRSSAVDQVAQPREPLDHPHLDGPERDRPWPRRSRVCVAPS